MRQDDAGIGQQPAPVAGMMAALAQIDGEVEIIGAPCAEKDRRPLRTEPRPVGTDKNVGGEQVLVLLAELFQARRTGLLPRLDQQFRIESERSPGPQHGFQRGDIDRVLALVVGGAAAVEPLALLGQDPGRQSLAPLLVIAQHHVAMSIGQNRRQIIGFVPIGQQEWSRPLARVFQDAAAVAHPFEGRLHLVGQIAVQHAHPLRVLAFRRYRNPAAQILDESALVEIAFDLRDRVASAHFNYLIIRECQVRRGPNTGPP